MLCKAQEKNWREEISEKTRLFPKKNIDKMSREQGVHGDKGSGGAWDPGEEEGFRETWGPKGPSQVQADTLEPMGLPTVWHSGISVHCKSVFQFPHLQWGMIKGAYFDFTVIIRINTVRILV